ncbi:MAG: septation regulator SpoVG [Clostridia bacterium]|nr:septation regulator SpoVG [Clostridia bacterium]
MQITDVRVRKLFEEGPMKAIVSVTFDNELALHDVKVIHAREKYFVVMPSRKNPDGTYRDIVHPINAASRNMLERAVIDAYFEKLKEVEENPEAAVFATSYED